MRFFVLFIIYELRVRQYISITIMEIPLGSLYQCRRGLLRRGWRRIEISVNS